MLLLLFCLYIHKSNSNKSNRFEMDDVTFYPYGRGLDCPSHIREKR
nr:MAG TPA: hypothetical protein [Caudoviricetes sp.]